MPDPKKRQEREENLRGRFKDPDDYEDYIENNRRSYNQYDWQEDDHHNDHTKEDEF